MVDFDAYFRELAATLLDDKTEHSDRAALEALLRQAANDAEPGALVQHEPRRDKAGAGSPDFKIMRGGRIAGYVEVKQIDENLSKTLRSEQIKKYRTLTDNLILTDYLEFIWIKPDGEMVRERLAQSDDLSARRLALRPERVGAIQLLLRGFFSATPASISKGHDLAVALARRAAMLRDFLSVELQRQVKEHREGRLLALYEVFKSQVFHELTIGAFADAFAQMLGYGLFLARLNAGDRETVTLENVRTHIPGSFALIRELVRFLDEMNEDDYREVRWVIDELLSIVNGIDLAAVHNDLSFRGRKAISRKLRAEDEEEHRLFEKDPFIYFYEDFLKAYDPEMRKGRGVYYTPPPVVNFIVRAIDDILRDIFGIERGLADHEQVTVLDFACGTGTFLLEVFERIFETIGGAAAGQADQVVREHLLRNLYGFEYLIAPYTIAHLKLSQYLKDKGHPLKADERLRVFLTNTLEPVEPQYDSYFPVISREVASAQEVKDREILVIMGNPPYAGHSKNKGKWIKREIDGYEDETGSFHAGYKHLLARREDINSSSGDGPEEWIPLGESNPKWLNDDYVKFIRFAQLKMERADRGIVGLITNHSWLDNPTFRAMRQSLLRTFDQIYVFDLHGSTKPREPVPDGELNGNVFDITKGVAIVLFVKSSLVRRRVMYSEAWGSRIDKYKACSSSRIADMPWQEVTPFLPYLLARPLEWTGWDEYKLGWPLADSLAPAQDKRQIFKVNVLGFQSHRDDFAIAFRSGEMENRLEDMLGSSSDAQIAEKYKIANNRDWKIADARMELRALERPKDYLVECSYRPFDDRPCMFSGSFMDYPRKELIENVLAKENLVLLASRQIGSEVWRHALVTKKPPNDCVVSDQSSEANYAFPLWLYGDARIENLTDGFRSFVDEKFGHHYTPDEIFGYIYAVLHAPTYRRRYRSFLRIDFPRIPFSGRRGDFEALSDLGWALVQVHLLKSIPKPPTRLGLYHGKGEHVVEAVRYSPEEQAIWINSSQRFLPVPQSVWDFHIGGYQVLDKYLKSRRGRALGLDETTHVGKVAEALAFTIAQMERIDVAYRAAFPDGG